MQAANQEIVTVHGDISRKLAMERGLMPIQDDELSTVSKMNKGRRKGWMRNKPCICGSAKKFKVCCWSKYQG